MSTKAEQKTSPTPSLAERFEAELVRTKELNDQFQAKLKNPEPPKLVTGAKAVYERVPNVRRGEDTQTSRGFQYLRLFGAAAGHIPWSHATVEKSMVDWMQGNNSERRLAQTPGYCQVPLGTELMPDTHYEAAKLDEFRQVMKAGVSGADPDHMAYIMKKAILGGMSYTDTSIGGAFVPPPAFGELIDLLRNVDALMRAGANVQALPPQGIAFPRLTSPTTGYWLGEKQDATASIPGTGILKLLPHKAVCLVTLPNELLRYGTVSGEAIVRTDITKTLSLTLDLALIDGQGGGIKPLGLLNTVGVGVVTPATVATDGNTLAPGDIYKFLSTVFGNNSEFTGFILRPDLFLQFMMSRSSVYNGSTTAALGDFLFSQMRDLGMGVSSQIAGYPATLSNNVPKNRVKGAGTTLTCMLGGNWPDFLIGLLGTIEFATTAEGIQLLQGDMTAIRGIITADGGARHPGAFAVCDNLLTALGA